MSNASPFQDNYRARRSPEFPGKSRHQDSRQFPRHFELDEMAAGHGVHRPARIVLHLVLECGEEPVEARRIRSEDIYLPFDGNHAARKPYRLSECSERLGRTLSLPKRDHFRTL